MLFNKQNKGSEELRNLTGSYYKSNDFSKIETDITLAIEEVSKIIGPKVMAAVEAAYIGGDNVSSPYQELVPYVQLPVAYLAVVTSYQKNDISHETDGRRVKLSPESEKLPWEWQLKRDDELHMDAYYKAMDRLISKLETINPNEWKDSEPMKTSRSLLLRNADEFHSCFPIDRSGRMYMLLVPAIKEAQRRFIKPVLGNDFQAVLDRTSGESVLEYAQLPLALFAMSIAVRRMPLGLIPFGVVRNYISSTQTMNASDPASLADVQTLSTWLEDDARVLLDELKRHRSGSGSEMELLPHNSPFSKGMRV